VTEGGAEGWTGAQTGHGPRGATGPIGLVHRVRRLGVGQGADAWLGTGHLDNNISVTTTYSDNNIQ